MKQGWRLMNKMQSLFCKVFKAQYFLNGSFLEAKKIWGFLCVEEHYGGKEGDRRREPLESRK